MELNKYIFPLRKWWWLVVASTLIATIFSSLSVLLQPTFYQSHTTLMIGTTINDPNPSSNELVLGQQLAAAYANLANREIVLNATKDALGMSQLPEYIAQALPNTQLIEITVKDSDPERAQIVANELAAQLILLAPITAQSGEQGRQEFIQERLTKLETQIKETEAEIEKLQEELANTFSAQQIDDRQDQIASLQSKLSTMENNYGLLLSNSEQGAINTLTVIASAELPSQPIGPMKGLTILLAAAAGFVLAACEAYLLDYLDDTLKSPDVVLRLFSAPIIGRISEQVDGTNQNLLYDADNSTHPLTEPYRALRTAIDFAERDRPLKKILVSSPDIGDGKTSVAVNLALSMAQANKKVYLLDADLRRPKIHKIFNLANDKGLADLVSSRAAITGGTEIQNVNKVAVLTAGTTPADPAQLFTSEKMDEFLSKVEEVADVVIIDGPPFFSDDAMILAGKVDGVLMVVRPGHTRRSLAETTMEHVKVVGARVVGVVLNRIPLRGAEYYAGRGYFDTYYRSTYGDERDGREKDVTLERLGETLTMYANKVTGSVKHFFKAVFKLSPK